MNTGEGECLTKRFSATSTEALFVSGGYMPLGKGDAVVI